MATTQQPQLVDEEVRPQQQEPQIIKYSLSHFHKNRRRHSNHHGSNNWPPLGGGGNGELAATSPDHFHRPAIRIPSVAVMAQRQAHRQQILASTETHLRTYDNHHHDDDDDDELEQRDTSRNILYVLMDRERRGPRTIVSLSRYRRFQKDHHRSKISGSSSTISTNNAGDRSPSTVLESPPTPAAAATARDNNENHHHVGSTSSHAHNSNNNSHRRHLSGGGGSSSLIIMEEQETSFNTTEEEEEDVDNDQGVTTPNSPTTTTRPPWQTKPQHPDEPTSLRRVSYPLTITRELQSFAEYASAVRYHSACLNHLGGDDIIDADGNRPVSSHAVSTISIAFSCDGRTVASTHGDHTVKISCCVVGLLLQCLDGHPRTPWTVKYHPTNPDVLASGCLGHQVRIWDWPRKICLQMVRLEFAIISLSFHPTGDLLAIANGTKLHFWGINNSTTSNTSTAAGTAAGGNNNSSSSSSRLMESDQKHMLRCVHFPPSGDTIIIGGANPMQEDPRQRRRNNNNNQAVGGNNGMSFYLRLWDFDLERALEMPQYINNNNNNNNIMSHSQHAVDNNNNSNMRDSIPFGITMGRRSISNVRFLFCLSA
jgi:WD domain, G-beta repeat